MGALGIIASGTMIAQTIHMAIPYACAALGGVLSERSGVVNIALEGTLLVSALASIVGTLATGSALLGASAGIVGGALVGLLHAALVVRGRMDAIVSGIALNLIAAGSSRFLLRALYGSSSNSPRINDWAYEGSSSSILRTLLDPFVFSTLLAIAFTAWLLRRTRFGLHLRACGEDPSAAQAVGIRVQSVRTAAVVLGGALAGLGGTALAFELRQFQSGMSGGRGFIALAAVIVSGWRPWPAAAACLIFASLEALQIVLQNQTRVPGQLLAVLPYVATLGVLALVGKRKRGAMRAPAGIAKDPE